MEQTRPHNPRQATWEMLKSSPAEPWDLIIVGGGITGAGILREAVRQGRKALLVEQHDFAWGTSSRSSKMVHGGLRYLALGDFKLTRDAVRERQRLLQEAPGLVEPLHFLMPHYARQFPGPRLFQVVLGLYDHLAGQKKRHLYSAAEAALLVPGLKQDRLLALSHFTDAVTDDARLVLRVLQEARAQGGVALNYVSAREVLRDQGRVGGVRLCDQLSGETLEIRARAVINATGAWSDQLRAKVGGKAQIRPLRGSHLVLPFWRLPLAWSVSFFHPQDRRPVFVFPWEGMTVIGTTDLDHADLDQEPRITDQEVDYLLAGANSLFPAARLGRNDILSTYAGVRPVVGSGSGDPSKEKRDHAIWDEQGLVTVAGGKLTTFRLIALDALQAAGPYLPEPTKQAHGEHIFAPLPPHLLDGLDLSFEQKKRLQGRFGASALELLEQAPPSEREPIANTQTLWAELRWSCRYESVVHLEDLLLRRTRLGLVLPQGGLAQLAPLQALCQETLGWDEERWEREAHAYSKLWRECYSLPEASVDDGEEQ